MLVNPVTKYEALNTALDLYEIFLETSDDDDPLAPGMRDLIEYIAMSEEYIYPTFCDGICCAEEESEE